MKKMSIAVLFDFFSSRITRQKIKSRKSLFSFRMGIYPSFIMGIFSKVDVFDWIVALR